jgi:hypothetical protein
MPAYGIIVMGSIAGSRSKIKMESGFFFLKLKERVTKLFVLNAPFPGLIKNYFHFSMTSPTIKTGCII